MFLQEYFIEPIINASGYNIYNTAVYALIFAAAVFLTYKLLRKWSIDINWKFWIGLTPYIVLGALLRSLEDAQLLTGAIFVTPLVYVLVFGIALVSLSASQRYKEPMKLWSFIGLVLCVAAVPFIEINQPLAFLIPVITAVWFLVFLAGKELTNFFSKENLSVLTAHVFDATSTFVAIQFFPYREQHVLSGFFIELLGPWSMYLLKVPLVIAVLYVLDKETGGQEKSFIKLAILMLGLAPGLRNFLRLLMGV